MAIAAYGEAKAKQFKLNPIRMEGMLLGVGLVIFAFGLAQPISALATTITRNTLGIALAIILLAFLMMITRRNAVSQVVGFLSMGRCGNT